MAAIAVGATVAVGFVALMFKTGEKKIEQTIARLYDADDGQFGRAMGVPLGPPNIEGNRFEVLLNGDEIFPSMLSAIRGAQKTITFESYIYWSGSIGREFAEALSERARAGVKVHVLLDWLGSSKLDAAQVSAMEGAGVVVRKFHEPAWYRLTRMNNRTHRKVLVVDGKVGFTGGVGIADAWAGHAQDPDHWRDTHFRAEGPVVAQMQGVFMDNWIKVSGEVLHDAEYFPPLAKRGEAKAQMFSSSPEGGSESMQLMYLLVITPAAKTIHLSSAYFVPDDLSLKALVAAAKRGVRVQIITPGEHMDAETVRKASRARWGDLLEAGVEINDRGRAVAVGRVHQLRQPVVLAQRRGEPQHHRHDLCHPPDHDFSAGSRAVQGDHAGGLAAATAGRKIDRAFGSAAAVAAVIGPPPRVVIRDFLRRTCDSAQNVARIRRSIGTIVDVSSIESCRLTTVQPAKVRQIDFLNSTP